jgi:fructokinase
VTSTVFGGVEGGGTKFACMIGTGPDDIVATRTFPTTHPTETLARVVEFFQHVGQGRTVRAVGVASFGPIDLDTTSPTFGFITTTPKAGWQFTDVVGELRARLGVPVGFDTDVNGAALGEYRWGAAQGADPTVYITVGTGIGGGAYVNGSPVHGLIHPEMGHMRLPIVDGDSFEGSCPYHGRCLEGLASGPAIGARAGRPATELAADDPIWRLEAQYLALALANIMYVLSPKRIVLGGGVMEQRQLFPLIHERVLALHNGYLQSPSILQHIDSLIVPPGLGSRCGMLGAIELARLAAESATVE